MAICGVRAGLCIGGVRLIPERHSVPRAAAAAVPSWMALGIAADPGAVEDDTSSHVETAIADTLASFSLRWCAKLIQEKLANMIAVR